MWNMWTVALEAAVVTLLMGAVTGQAPKTEHGVVMTTLPNDGDKGGHLRSFSFMPHYEADNYYLHGVRFKGSDTSFLSVDTDSRTNTLYLYSYNLRAIAVGHNYNIEMDIGNMTFDILHAGVSKQTVQVAYDWLSQVLYWADPTFNWIVAAPGKKELIQKGWYKIIAHEHLSSPEGIAVDPLAGLLFWTDTYVNPKIERSNLDGSDRSTLFTSGLMTPLSIEVDHLTKKIFWIDSDKEVIESANYDGTGRKRLKLLDYSYMFDLAIYKDVLMVSDNINYVGDLHVLNKTDGSILETKSFMDYGVEEQLYGLGIYHQDNQPLRVKDYCAALNCTQMCISTMDGAKCKCSDGYKLLQNDSRTCEEDTGAYHIAFVLSTENEICLGDIRAISRHDFGVHCIYSTAPPTTASPTQAPNTSAPGTSKLTTVATQTTTGKPAQTLSHGTIRLLELNMADRIIYFATESGIFRIAVDVQAQNNHAETILYGPGTANITGLAYDWINPGYLYWCTDTGVIYSTNVQQTETTTILSSAGSNTKGLILLPHERKLAWLSGHPGNFILRSMYLDGSSITTLLTGLNNPTGLNRDQDNKRIYMIDEGTVKRVAYNETGPPLTFIRTAGQDILMYKSYFVIMTTVPGTTTFDSYNRRSLENVNSGQFLDERVFTDVKILDATLQPSEPSPCHHENGGCEQICSSVFDAGGHATLKCRCVIGYSIDPTDKSKCITVSGSVVDDFMMVTDWTHDALYQIDLLTDKVHAVDVTLWGTPTGIIYNHRTRKIVFGDMYDTVVHQANLDGTGAEIVVEIETYSFPNRMDIDETTGNIYYTAGYMSHVGIITPRGTYITLDMDVDMMSELVDIVVHPGIGRFYFSVDDTYNDGVEDRDSYIAMANMDGTDNTIIIKDGAKIHSPHGLALDFTDDKLYWSDGYYHTISRCGLDGRNCSLFITDKVANFHDIVVDGKYLYYLDWAKDYVTRVLLSDPTSTKMIAQNAEMGRLDTMFIYQSTSTNKQPVNQYCKDNSGLGDCSTICLPTNKSRTCACDRGHTLKGDSMTCSNVHQCNNTIGEATLPDTCSRWTNATCDYTCPKKYEPTGSNTKVVCTSDGWDRRNEILCKERKCPTSIANGTLLQCSLTIGSSCKFSCDRGYRKPTGITAIVCSDAKEWHTNGVSSEPCIVYKCNKTIGIATLPDTCNRLLDSTCDYECPDKYQPSATRLKVQCTSDGWDRRDDTLCKEKQCPSTIPNGRLSSCPRKIGTTCSFSCNQDYKKPAGIQTVFCSAETEWHTNGASASPCINASDDVICGSKEVKHGSLTPNCVGKLNEVCSYSCDKMFAPTTNATDVTCRSDETWSQGLDTVCSEKQCPSTIPNGRLSSCPRKIGTTCSFSCKPDYKKTAGIQTVFCSAETEWHTNGASASPCINAADDVICGSKEVKHGSLTPNCVGKLNEVCSYSCDKTFAPTTNATDVTCRSDETWSQGLDTVCSEKQCPSTIPNGRLSSCPRKIGTTCSFSCKQDYKKPAGIQTVFCSAETEWHTNGASASPCINAADDVICGSKEVKHGSLTPNCVGKLNEVCSYSCDKTFAPTTNATDVTCRSDGTWSQGLDTVCSEILCASTVKHGTILSCSRRVGSLCNYSCESGYEKPPGIETLVCTDTFQWQTKRMSVDACTVPGPVVESQTGLSNEGEVAGLGVGVAILAIVIVGIIVALVFFRRRLLPSSGSAGGVAMYTNSNGDGPHIAISNPGYSEFTNEEDKHNNEEYSTVDPEQMQPFSFAGLATASPDNGIVNPVYENIQKGGNEPLPAYGTVDITAENVVLTEDSWQKEKKMGDDNVDLKY